MRGRNWGEWVADLQQQCTDPALRLHHARIPEHYRSVTWDDYDGTAKTAEGERLKTVLQFYPKDWLEHRGDPVNGMTVLGKPGVGKTLGGVLALMDLIQAGVWCKFVTHEQLTEMKQQLIGLEQQAEATDDFESYNKARSRMLMIEVECDVLMLDDVGKAYRSATRYADTYLDSLLRRRGMLGKTTVLTSNVEHDAWRDFDPSLASYLYEIGEIVTVLNDAPDRRSRANERQVRRRGGRGRARAEG